MCRTFPGLLSFLLLALIGMLIAIFIHFLLILLALKGGKVRVPDVFRTFPGLLSFLLLVLIAILINLGLGLDTAVRRNIHNSKYI